jgi:hypothetical protein
VLRATTTGAQVLVGQQAGAQAGQVEGQGAGLLLLGDAGEAGKLLGQPLRQFSLAPVRPQALQRLAEGGEVPDGEGGDPLGNGFQALLPGLVDKVLFGLLEESLQALAGGLGAAEAFHASDGAAGQGGPRHAQGAQDLQEDIYGLGDGLVGHPASPLWGNGGYPNYTPDRIIVKPHPSPSGFAATPSPLLTFGQERGGGAAAGGGGGVRKPE